MALPTFLAGGRITAAQLAALLPIRAYKPADTAIVSSTVQVADPDLQVTVLANSEYDVKLQMGYFQPSTAQVIAQFAGPASSAFNWSAVMLDQGVTASNVGSIRPLARTMTDTLQLGGNLSVATTAFFSGRLVVGATAGQFGLRWAPSANVGTAVTVQANSYLFLQQIA